MSLIDEPGAQLILVYGRRRVGKTTLLTHWANQTGLPVFYWVAKRDPRQVLMANLANRIYGWQHETDMRASIRPQDWEQVFHMLAEAIGEQRAIIILDELPYALQQDRGLGSPPPSGLGSSFQGQPRAHLSIRITHRHAHRSD